MVENKRKNNKYGSSLRWGLLIAYLFFQVVAARSQTIDSLTTTYVAKSIYPTKDVNKGSFYSFLWGNHYREVYGVPILVPKINLKDLYAYLEINEVHRRQYGAILKSPSGNTFALRFLGGYTAFMESGFYKEIYNPREYEKTYLGNFIKDGYTITNPYLFIVANELAGKLGLSSFNYEIFDLSSEHLSDTVFQSKVGHRMEEHLVSLFCFGNQSENQSILDTDSLTVLSKEDPLAEIDIDTYLKERMFDMLIGEWNLNKENLKWIGEYSPDSNKIIYKPLVLDRADAFTRIDGFFFKRILGMFGLSKIPTFAAKYGDLKKLNYLSLSADQALTSHTQKADWVAAAQIVRKYLSDDVIDRAFSLLPPQVIEEGTDVLKAVLKRRRDNIELVAEKYYDFLQKSPVITASPLNDTIMVDRYSDGATHIGISNENKKLFFDKTYSKGTKAIWIYGLEGNDRFDVSGYSDQSIPLVLIGGKGNNNYKARQGGKIRIYEGLAHSSALDSVNNTKFIKTDIEKVVRYDSHKLKYSSFDFSPWGTYDSDLGLYLGAYVTYTMYDFKRAPYTYRHRLGYNYLNGFMYQGFFPSYDEKKVFTLEAFVGTSNNFVNFFGFGNETSGFKHEDKKYNRVNLSRYSLTPSFYYKWAGNNKLTASTTIEVFRLSKSNHRYVNDLFDKGNVFFDTKTFLDLNLEYSISQHFSSFISLLDFSTQLGWKMNLGDWQRSYTYLNSNLALDFSLTDRLTLATEFEGNFLFTDKFEFYQAATTNLRGYRSNRFIGRQSYFQHSDLRFDLGHLKNPFAPVLYGVFGGFDYGRVWMPGERSKKWRNSYGGGLWITLFKNYTGKFSYFCSKDGNRFSFGLGLGF